MTLGEWLKSQRLGLGLTWAEMEAKTGMSTNALRNIENNPDARPGYDTVMKIADGLDADRYMVFKLAKLPTHTDEPMNLTPEELAQAMQRTIDKAKGPTRESARKMWQALAILLHMPSGDEG